MDGIAIRPLTAADGAIVAEGFELLSPESRYLRYGRGQLDFRVALEWVERLDDRVHAALGACAHGSPVGVARFVRVDDATAEIAVTVIDQWQGCGVGRMLLAQLVERAHVAGLRTLRAHIIAGNRPAVRLMRGIGGRRLSSAGGLTEYEAELGEAAPFTVPADASAGPPRARPAPGAPQAARGRAQPRASASVGMTQAQT